MKWKLIETDVDGRHDNRPKKPETMFASLNGNTFTLNNLAVNELCDIWGGTDYGINLYISECKNFIAFGVKEQTRETSSLVKTISSKQALDELEIYGKHRIELKVEEGMLVGDVSLIKRECKAWRSRPL